jgi:hypothetical protein
MKYAVYVVIVEDSEDADTRLAESVEQLERVGDALDWADAQALQEELEAVAR